MSQPDASDSLAAGDPAARHPSTARRIPSLDGLRAIAILCVVIGHAANSPGFPAGAFIRAHLSGIARFGVIVFFVISGFLITGLLVDEYAANGSISLRRFYFRRTLRILPAFYVLIAAAIALAALGIIPAHASSTLWASLYLANYSHLTIHADYLAYPYAHTWSLAVEEQFYLLWPALLLLLRPWRAACLAASLLLIVPVVIVLEARLGVGGIDESFETVAATLAAGCVLSLLVHLRPVPTRRALRSWLGAATGLIGVAAPMLLPSGITRHLWMVRDTLAAVGLALVMGWCIERHRSAPGRLLNWPPVRYIGRVSYSLYLWQQIFLTGDVSAWWHRYPLNVLLAFTATIGSYYIIERPALRFRQRLEERMRRPGLAAT